MTWTCFHKKNPILVISFSFLKKGRLMTHWKLFLVCRHLSKLMCIWVSLCVWYCWCESVCVSGLCLKAWSRLTHRQELDEGFYKKKKTN